MACHICLAHSILISSSYAEQIIAKYTIIIPVESLFSPFLSFIYAYVAQVGRESSSSFAYTTSSLTMKNRAEAWLKLSPKYVSSVTQRTCTWRLKGVELEGGGWSWWTVNADKNLLHFLARPCWCKGKWTYWHDYLRQAGQDTDVQLWKSTLNGLQECQVKRLDNSTLEAARGD